MGLSLLLGPAPATAAPEVSPAPAAAAPVTAAEAPAKAAEAPVKAVGPEVRAPSRVKVRSALRVGTTDYGGSRISPGLVARIEALGLTELRSAGIITAVNGEYTVELVIAPLGDESYVTTVTAFRGDEEITSAHHRSRCELCLEDELLVQVKGLVKSTAEILDRHANPPPAVADTQSTATATSAGTQTTQTTQTTTGPSGDEAATTGGDGDSDGDDDGEKKPTRLGKAGRAGVGTLVLGTLALGSGIGLFVAGEKQGANYQIPSFVLMGTGALALVTGIGLLVVDRETRRANQAAAHGLAPMVGRGGGGVVWVGRF